MTRAEAPPMAPDSSVSAKWTVSRVRRESLGGRHAAGAGEALEGAAGALGPQEALGQGHQLRDLGAAAPDGQPGRARRA